MKYPDLLSGWQLQTITEHDRLLNAKRQVHQAVQLVSLAARGTLPFHPWEIFGNLEWRPDLNMFLGRDFPGRFDLRIGLRVTDLTLHLCTPQGRSFKHWVLSGKTYQEGFEWLKGQIQDFGIDATKLTTELPYEIPDYPQANGAPFDLNDEAAFADFARTYSNAHLILNHVADLHLIWQNIRAWPHHFDISSRRRFKHKNQFWHMGVGYSPGDDHNYASPYWHLTCYPSDLANKENLPELPGKLRWHNEKWFGVVLLWDDIVQAKDKEGQLKMVLDIVESGMGMLEERVG